MRVTTQRPDIVTVTKRWSVTHLPLNWIRNRLFEKQYRNPVICNAPLTLSGEVENSQCFGFRNHCSVLNWMGFQLLVSAAARLLGADAQTTTSIECSSELWQRRLASNREILEGTMRRVFESSLGCLLSRCPSRHYLCLSKFSTVHGTDLLVVRSQRTVFPFAE
jgi:hypothetical protein